MKPKLSKDGEKVLKILLEKYSMRRESAIKLMQDYPVLAMAVLTKARR